MTKRTILSLPEEVMKQADQLAAELRVSRAEFIRRAIAAYVEELQRKKEAAEALREREEASLETERIRKRLKEKGGSQLDSTMVIREWRDKDRLDRMYERQDAGKVMVREDEAKP